MQNIQSTVNGPTRQIAGHAGELLNGSYKLGNGNWRDRATRERISLKAQPAWLAVRFDGDRYSIYLGTVEQLGMQNAIPV